MMAAVAAAESAVCLEAVLLTPRFLFGSLSLSLLFAAVEQLTTSLLDQV
jgi:hypothetical protein